MCISPLIIFLQSNLQPTIQRTPIFNIWFTFPLFWLGAFYRFYRKIKQNNKTIWAKMSLKSSTKPHPHFTNRGMKALEIDNQKTSRWQMLLWWSSNKIQTKFPGRPASKFCGLFRNVYSPVLLRALEYQIRIFYFDCAGKDRQKLSTYQKWSRLFSI